jgi:uncharacterized protein YigE (DUF2233 family)
MKILRVPVIIGSIVTVLFLVAFSQRIPAKPNELGDEKMGVSIKPTVVEIIPKTIKMRNEIYAYIVVSDIVPANIMLIPNFDKMETFHNIITTYGCTNAINGGFYTKDHLPLGLFVAGGKKYGKVHESRLTDGYFSIVNQKANIDSQVPSDEASTVIQSGPILIADGQALNLNIIDDEFARRSVVSIASSGKVSIISVYNSDSVFKGPMLADVPQIITSISKKENLQIVTALNLDGGSASAIYTSDSSLEELSPIGSLICVK